MESNIPANPNQEIILTPEQERQIIELWNQNPSKPPGLKELTKAVSGTEQDGRSFWGKAIKSFLVRSHLEPVTTKYVRKSDDIVLTEEHKQYLVNNAGTMSPLE